MNATVLVVWFRDRHHTTPDTDRWERTLPHHDPAELAAALDRWPGPLAPTPADIGRLIRQARTETAEQAERRAADAALARLRAAHPRRTPADRRRAELIDQQRAKRPTPNLKEIA